MKPKAAAIIPAAGSGTRMNTTIPKQFLPLAGTPVLVRTVSKFADCPFISQIIVAAPKDSIEDTKNILGSLKGTGAPVLVVPGGLRRQDSVSAALDMVNEDIEVVLVHDGARPLVSEDLIERCYKEGGGIRSSHCRCSRKRHAEKRSPRTGPLKRPWTAAFSGRHRHRRERKEAFLSKHSTRDEIWK